MQQNSNFREQLDLPFIFLADNLLSLLWWYHTRMQQIYIIVINHHNNHAQLKI